MSDDAKNASDAYLSGPGQVAAPEETLSWEEKEHRRMLARIAAADAAADARCRFAEAAAIERLWAPR